MPINIKKLLKITKLKIQEISVGYDIWSYKTDHIPSRV
jgi:hypothetical protein